MYSYLNRLPRYLVALLLRKAPLVLELHLAKCRESSIDCTATTLHAQKNLKLQRALFQKALHDGDLNVRFQELHRRCWQTLKCCRDVAALTVADQSTMRDHGGGGPDSLGIGAMSQIATNSDNGQNLVLAGRRAYTVSA